MLGFGIPIIAYCDDGDEQTSSDGETDAGIGAQESIGARAPGEGASNMELESAPESHKRKADRGDDVGPSSRRRIEDSASASENSNSSSWRKYLNLSSDSEGQGQGPENNEAEPASRKRSADPREDVGPSSVRQRVDLLNAPGAGDPSGPSSSISELRTYLKELGTANPESLSDWITTRETLIHEQLNKLRKAEHMRPLAPHRMQAVIQFLESEYGPESLNSILEELETHGLNSSFYKESKIERTLPKEQELKKENF